MRSPAPMRKKSADSRAAPSAMRSPTIVRHMIDSSRSSGAIPPKMPPVRSSSHATAGGGGRSPSTESTMIFNGQGSSSARLALMSNATTPAVTAATSPLRYDRIRRAARRSDPRSVLGKGLVIWRVASVAGMAV